MRRREDEGVGKADVVISRILGPVAVLSVAAVLISLLWTDGQNISSKDPRVYLQPALSVAAGEGLIARTYDVGSDNVALEILTHYPPLTSLFLGALVFLGAPPDVAPTLFSLGAWVFLLAGAFFLAVRWGESSAAGWYGAALVAITAPILERYRTISSEALFLPLLLGLAVCLPDPREEAVKSKQLVICSALCALLMTTRYAGIFVVFSLLAWWMICRLSRVPLKPLLGELSILALSGLPLALWFARNHALTGTLFGPTHGSGPVETTTFASNAGALFWQAATLALPAVKPGPILRELGLPAAAAVGLFLGAGICLLWFGRKRIPRGFLLAGPLAALLPGYLLIHGAGPFFLHFRSLDERYMTPVLALFFPLLAAWLWLASPPLGRRFLGAFVGLNLLFLAILPVRAGVLGMPGGKGPLIADFTGRGWEADEAAGKGTPSWLLRRPPRLKDIERHLPELHRRMAEMPSSTPVVTNAADLLITKVVSLPSRSIEEWLDRGTCSPAAGALAIVAVDWDRWNSHSGGEQAMNDASDLIARVTAKCSAAAVERLPGATVFLISGQGTEQGVL